MTIIILGAIAIVSITLNVFLIVRLKEAYNDELARTAREQKQAIAIA
jgi:hypothetical protein